MGQYEEALSALERPREIADSFAAADPKNATKAGARAGLYITRANIHLALRQKQEALDDYLTAIRIYDGMVAVDPARTSSRMIRASCEAFVARMLAKQGRMAEAGKLAKAGIDDLENLADRPNATAQYLDEASIALMVTPVMSLRDYPRALRYAQQADEISHGREATALAYLAMAYANVGEAEKALDTVQRGLAMVPAPPPGQKPSQARENLENELRDIRILIRTGH